MASHAHSPFPSTHWSVITLLRQGPDGPRLAALDGILRRYLPALKAHLLSWRRMPADEADDLLQGFIADRVLEKNLLARADPLRGRFRNFLVRCLENYAISVGRREKAAGALRLEDAPEPAAARDDPGLVFDRAWAREVVTETVRRVQEECAAKQRDDVWGVFESRVLGPTLNGTPPLPYEQLVARLNLPSPSQAANLLITAKRMYQRLLREVIAEYVEDEREIEGEIAELMQVLGKDDAG